MRVLWSRPSPYALFCDASIISHSSSGSMKLSLLLSHTSFSKRKREYMSHTTNAAFWSLFSMSINF